MDPPSPPFAAAPPGDAALLADNNDPPDAFRRLTVRETFRCVYTLYVDSAHARLFLSLAGLLVLPCTLVAIVVVNYVSKHVMDATLPQQVDGSTSRDTYGLQIWLGIGTLGCDTGWNDTSHTDTHTTYNHARTHTDTAFILSASFD
jgi:hypothetical protein